VAVVIAGITLIALFLNQDYRIGVVGALVWFLLGIVYFQFRGRKCLVLAPEEEFAQTAAGAITGSDVRTSVR
jgi:ethanolamine permease